MVVTDSSGTITLPGGGKGVLQSRTYKGAANSSASGRYVYEYRLDLTNAAGNAGACATMLTVDFGPIVSTLDYNQGVLTGDQVFVTTVGGVGTIGLASASQTGRLITFHFQTPVCPGALPGGGKSSYPNNSMAAYVMLSQYRTGGDPPGHVFKTTDGGGTWSDISSNLPNVPAYDIVIDPDVASTLYLGADTGVFVSTNGGASWLPLGTGLPRVPVYSLKLLRPARILRAATWGRSVWDLGF